MLGLDGRTSSLNGYSEASAFDFIHIHPSIGDDPTELCDSAIITLRHPHKTIKTGKWAGTRAEPIVNSWKALTDIYGKYDKVLILVIDGPEEKRFPQLMAIAEHFDKGHLEVQVKQYADDWSPVNQSITSADIDRVQFAVSAYKKWQ